jgi:hypothetical protein
VSIVDKATQRLEDTGIIGSKILNTMMNIIYGFSISAFKLLDMLKGDNFKAYIT